MAYRCSDICVVQRQADEMATSDDAATVRRVAQIAWANDSRRASVRGSQRGRTLPSSPSVTSGGRWIGPIALALRGSTSGRSEAAVGIAQGNAERAVR